MGYRWIGLGTSMLLSILWLKLFDAAFTLDALHKTIFMFCLQSAAGYWVGERMDKLRSLAFLDSLTGVLVNRRFCEKLEKEIERARRNRYEVTLMFIDLDNFKKYNDQHGHLAGDRVLCQFALLLQRAVRAHDIVGRWGGEEFVVLLPHTGTAQGMAVGERIQTEVRRELKGVTVSIGLATFPYHAGSALDLTARADALMYEAKKKRDCMLTAMH
ncbi:GGDEF domain-containing protein [Brevibacillus sp. SYP-B805]|nr:GGDEF domain-containing protein [Brevibacillus sp. SYP-B805]